jgi:hypothetical protein
VAAITFRLQLPDHFLGTRAERAGFVLLLAFLLSFLFIRTSARLMRSPKVPWWPGSVTTESGLHIHHLVWGIVLVLLSGFLGFALEPKSPGIEILAAGFGVGTGFTLDEFALWVRLEDVYWAREGRASLDAVIVATVIGALVVLGLAPFDETGTSPGLSLLIVVLIDLSLCIVAILKGRPLLALIGVFIPFVSFGAAVRLAAPTSPWGRRRYRPDSRKLARATSRFARADARHRWLMDAIGGSPTPEVGAASEPAKAE